MTDLAQKIADAVVTAGYAGDVCGERVVFIDRQVVREAIRTALPVAQGEAVACDFEFRSWCTGWFGPDADEQYLAKAVAGLPSTATTAPEAQGEAVAPFAYAVVGGRVWQDSVYMSLDAAEVRVETRHDGSRLIPLYAAPPASRIAELEAQVERLRAAGKEAGHTILAYINGEKHSPGVSHAIALAHGMIDGTADAEKLVEYYFDKVEAESSHTLTVFSTQGKLAIAALLGASRASTSANIGSRWLLPLPPSARRGCDDG